MSVVNTLERLTTIYRRIFQAPDLVATRELTAADVARWDSLTHVEMIAAVEQEFSIRFKLKDLVKLRNTGDLVDAIERMQQA